MTFDHFPLGKLLMSNEEELIFLSLNYITYSKKDYISFSEFSIELLQSLFILMGGRESGIFTMKIDTVL